MRNLWDCREARGEPVDRNVLQRMTDAMVHRGPDDDGYLLDGSVGLGFRRLSIVDTKSGQQPMTNEDGTVWVVFNGEIYNYKELHRDLVASGHRFRSQCDTEVIVHLYEERGIDCLKLLRGMFGLAIYDANQQTLYLARDHFGIKPLFYANTPAQVIFGSDIKSILSAQPERSPLSLQSLWNYLTFQYVPDPFTMFQDIVKVPPGHYAQVRDAEVSLHAYWRAEFRPDESKPLSYFIEGIQHHLQESVRMHLSGEVRRGAFLSSGVDSSAIAALMMRHEPIQTFAVGYTDSTGYPDEAVLAAQTARALGTQHHQVTISATDYQEELPRLIYHQEDPVADPSAIALHFVAELASSYVTVVLSGEGADEVFGGYPIYHEPVSLRGFRHAPNWVRNAAGKMALQLPEGMKGRSFLERGSVPLTRRFIGNAKIFTDDVKHLLLSGDFPFDQMRSSYDVTDTYYAHSQGLDDITRMQDIDMHTWLPGDILAKADKMTMANSVELRVPFLDRVLFEFASTIPAKYRIRGHQTKFALRQAVADWLPREVSQRPKLGFPVPLRQWLRGPMLEFTWAMLNSGSARHYFNTRAVGDMLYEHAQGTRDHTRALWTLLAFTLWHQIYIEGRHQFVPTVSPRVQVRRRRYEDTTGMQAGASSQGRRD